MMSPADRAAAALRQCVELPPSFSPPATRRSRFVEAATRPVPSKNRLTFSLALAVSVLLVLGAWHWGPWSRGNRAAPLALTYQIGERAVPGQIGAYFALAHDENVPLRFSDGSLITLLGSSRARVTAANAAGASVLLETGAAVIEVVHRTQSAWTMTTGPYTVSVTGTAFSLSWEPVSGTLDIEMFSGSVVVHGPGAEAGVLVRGLHRFVSHEGPKDSPSSPEAVPPPVVPTAEVPAQAALPSREPKRTVSEPKAERWSTLAAQGNYQRVMDLALARGIDGSLNSVDMAELGALADSAKYTGQADLARRALLSLRARFSGSPRAVSAAFLLGRMLDDAGSASSAIDWYNRYLTEAPDGSFAPEALGRRMLTLRRTGQEDASRRAAHDYLQRFPRGPYAGIATDIAGR